MAAKTLMAEITSPTRERGKSVLHQGDVQFPRWRVGLVSKLEPPEGGTPTGWRGVSEIGEVNQA